MNPSSPGQYDYDRKESDARFVDTIWPAIRPEWDWFADSELMGEEESSEIKRLLDMDGNIDFMARRHGGGVIGIASRVQRQFWRTFTIRVSRRSGARTELVKTREAIARADQLAAAYHVQGYVHRATKRLWKVFGTRMAGLYRDEALDLGELKTAPDGNEFLAVPVDELIALGVQVKEYPLKAGANPGPRDFRSGDRWLPWHFADREGYEAFENEPS